MVVDPCGVGRSSPSRHARCKLCATSRHRVGITMASWADKVALSRVTLAGGSERPPYLVISTTSSQVDERPSPTRIEVGRRPSVPDPEEAVRLATTRWLLVYTVCCSAMAVTPATRYLGWFGTPDVIQIIVANQDARSITTSTLGPILRAAGCGYGRWVSYGSLARQEAARIIAIPFLDSFIVVPIPTGTSPDSSSTLGTRQEARSIPKTT